MNVDVLPNKYRGLPGRFRRAFSVLKFLALVSYNNYFLLCIPDITKNPYQNYIKKLTFTRVMTLRCSGSPGSCETD